MSVLAGTCTDLEKSVCRERWRIRLLKSCIAHAHRGLTWLHHKQKTGLMHECKGLAGSYVDDATMHACGSRGDPGAIKHCCLKVCLHRYGPRTGKCQRVVAEIITQCFTLANCAVCEHGCRFIQTRSSWR